MDTRIDHIAGGIYRISTWFPQLHITQNQFLIDDDAPTLIHTGEYALYDNIRAAIAKVLDPKRLANIALLHWEGDENGGMDRLLQDAPQSQLVGSTLSINLNARGFGFTGRVHGAQDGDTLDLGRHKLRFLETPHVHHWDSMMVVEETTGSLFPADLFIQPGDQPPVVTEDLSGAMCELYRQVGIFAHECPVRTVVDRLSSLPLNWIHAMHGGTLTGAVLPAYSNALRQQDFAFCGRLLGRELSASPHPTMVAWPAPSAAHPHATFRELNNTNGRWLSPDPYDGSYNFANPQSLNRYVYALNNPIRLVDPSGMDDDCGGAQVASTGVRANDDCEAGEPDGSNGGTTVGGGPPPTPTDCATYVNGVCTIQLGAAPSPPPPPPPTTPYCPSAMACVAGAAPPQTPVSIGGSGGGGQGSTSAPRKPTTPTPVCYQGGCIIPNGPPLPPPTCSGLQDTGIVVGLAGTTAGAYTGVAALIPGAGLPAAATVGSVGAILRWGGALLAAAGHFKIGCTP